MTNGMIKSIMNAIKVGCAIRVAYQAAGIGWTTFTTWIDRGKSREVAGAPYRAYRAEKHAGV